MGLFTRSADLIGSSGWWGSLTASLAAIAFALVLIARSGWQDDLPEPHTDRRTSHELN